jgi:hypothetical protein
MVTFTFDVKLVPTAIFALLRSASCLLDDVGVVGVVMVVVGFVLSLLSFVAFLEEWHDANISNKRKVNNEKRIV